MVPLINGVGATLRPLNILKNMHHMLPYNGKQRGAMQNKYLAYLLVAVTNEPLQLEL
jgi:hypothetical protein